MVVEGADSTEGMTLISWIMWQSYRDRVVEGPQMVLEGADSTEGMTMISGKSLLRPQK